MKSFVIVTYYHLAHAIALTLDSTFEEKPNLYFVSNFLKPSSTFIDKIASTDVFNKVVVLEQKAYTPYMIPELLKTKDMSSEEIDKIGSSIFDKYMNPYFDFKFKDADYNDEIFVYSDFQWDYYYIAKNFNNIIGVEDGYGIIDTLAEFELSENRKLREPFFGKYYPVGQWKYEGVKKIISSVPPTKDIPEHKGKICVIDYNDLIRRNKDRFLRVMSTIFDIQPATLTKHGAVFLTQPFNKAGYCSEEECFLLNKTIIWQLKEKYGYVYIKPHPADNLDYSTISCDNIKILNKDFPAELLNAYSEYFKCAVSVSSTAVNTLTEIKHRNVYLDNTTLCRQDVTEFINKTIDDGAFSRERKRFKIPANKNVKKGFLDYYFGCDVVKNTILLEGLGKSYKGNLFYLIKELSKRGDLKIYYSVTNETITKTREFHQSRGMNNIEYLIAGSGKYRKALATVEFLINEVDFPNYWIKKHGQKYLNIWHGTPLKKLGCAREDQIFHEEGTLQKNLTVADYILSPNEHTRTVFENDYDVAELGNQQFIMCGYPRTSRLMKDANKEVASMGKRIAFMPTWREKEQTYKQLIELDNFLKEISFKLTENETLYVNLHHKISNEIDIKAYRNIQYFPDNMDTYEFLDDVDVLITDYSSVMFDFATTRKKIVLYCPDENLYINDRGVYFDLHKSPFPFPIASETTMLLEKVRSSNYKRDYDDTDFMKTFCAFESNNNANTILNIFIDDKDEATRVNINNFDKRKKTIFAHSDSLGNSRETTFIHDFSNSSQEGDYNLYISYNDKLVSKNVIYAYPLIEKNLSFGCKGKPLFTKYQKLKRNKFGITPATIKYSQKSYKTEFRRRYGNAKIDCFIVFECYDPDTIIAFSYFDCKKYLLVDDEILRAMKTDLEYSLAVRKYAKKCDKIFYGTKHSPNDVRNVFPYISKRRFIPIESGKNIWGWI